MNRIGRINEKSWTSNDKNYEITVWMEKMGIKGELYERSKRYSLNEALAMDRDFPYFPSEVSDNLNRLVYDLTKK